MKIDYNGFAALCPHKKGVILNSKSISVIEFIKKPKRMYQESITKTRPGVILTREKNKNEIIIIAKFRKELRKKIPKKLLVKTIISSIDFKKENLIKSFRKMLYFNFTEKDLKKLSASKCLFEVPKQLRRSLEGERMYLKAKGRYYEL